MVRLRVNARKAPATLVLAILAVGLGVVCASNPRLPTPISRMAWPPAPEEARVVLVGEFRGPGDLGLRGGLGRGLLDLLGGQGEIRFVRPYAVAVFGEAEGTGPGGGSALGPARIAVTDTGAKVVHVFDLEHGDHKILSEVTDQIRLLSPIAVAYDAERRLYVCDSALGMLLRYDAEGGFDRVLSRSLGRPSGLAIDRSRGVVYVADASEHIVRRFDLDGTPAGEFAGPFRFPTHLAVDGEGRLIVSDSMNFRVAVLSPDGKLVATVGRPGDGSGDLQRPKGVAVDSAGHLYVIDAVFDNVQIFDLSGRLLLAVGGPGDGPGELALPAGLAIDGRDLIYVADSFNGRIQVFRYLGRDQP